MDHEDSRGWSLIDLVGMSVCLSFERQEANPFGEEESTRGGGRGWALEVEAAELRGLFEDHEPVAGKLSAVNARTPLIESGLPTDTLR